MPGYEDVRVLVPGRFCRKAIFVNPNVPEIRDPKRRTDLFRQFAKSCLFRPLSRFQLAPGGNNFAHAESRSFTTQ